MSPEVHATLSQRAKDAGQSLQQYLSDQLDHLAATPTVDEVIRRVERRPSSRLSAEQAIEALDAARADR